MMEQGVNESAVRISWGGMNDHAVSFVKNDEMFVFEKNIERDILWTGDVGNRFWNDDGNFIAGMDAVAGFRGLSVQ
jgi:hypothetical protein